MTNQINALFKVLILTFICLVYANLVCGQTELSGVIRQEFDSLKLIAKLPLVKLTIVKEPNSSSESQRVSEEIKISLPELKDVIKKVGNNYETAIIRLIIAHELGHQLQYIFQRTFNKHRTGECQADILSGFLIFQITMQDILKKQEGLKKLVLNDTWINKETSLTNNMLLALYSSIYYFGDNYNLDNTHPRGSERMTAVRTGFAYGGLWLFDEQSKDPNIPVLQRKSKSNFAKRLKVQLNYLSDDNVLTWSDRIANKIVHTDLSLCKYIIVYNKWDWDTSSHHPYLLYEQNIRNIGDRRITISFLNQLYIRNRKNPKNMLLWDNINTAAKIVTLNPGESKHITDSLKWNSTDKSMPSYVPFGDPYSLYTCQTLNYNGFKDPSNIQDKIGTKAIEPKQKTILDVLFTYRNRFDRLIAGVGTEDEINAHTLSYQCVLEYPQSEESWIEYDTDKKVYSLKIYATINEKKITAEHKLQILLDVLKSIDKPFYLEKSDKQGSTYAIATDKNNIEGRASFLKNRLGNYNLTLEIFADN